MAIKIINDKCKGCTLCAKACPFDALKIVDRLAIVDEGKCTNCNACIAKCKFDAIEAAPEAEKVDLSAYKHIWVFAEQRQGKLMNVALELIGEGYRLAKEISEDTQVCAVLVGNNIDHLADECFAYGAEKVYMIQDPLLENFTTDAYTKVLKQAIDEYKPEIVLYGATHIGRDLAPRVAARMNTGLTADCTRLDVDMNEYFDYLHAVSNADTAAIEKRLGMDDKTLNSKKNFIERIGKRKNKNRLVVDNRLDTFFNARAFNRLHNTFFGNGSKPECRNTADKRCEYTHTNENTLVCSIEIAFTYKLVTDKVKYNVHNLLR